MPKSKKLAVIDGETLMDMRLEPVRYCIEGVLSQGVAMMSGAPKIGKSWMMLDWSIRIAKGENVWGYKTTKGATLYLCLEDNWNRVQSRLFEVTDEAPNNAYFAISSCSLADGLEKQITDFVTEHKDTVLVIIDTFQMIRNGNLIGDRLWLEHFANALHNTVFNDDEYRKLMRLIDRELSRKYKGKI